MICIYHSADLDGICSAAIVKHRFPHAELIGYDHGQSLPLLNTNKMVMVVDLSLPLDDIRRLANSCQHLTWIDHHKSSLTELENTPPMFLILNMKKLKAIIDTGKSACELTWQYLFPNKHMPEFVELLGKYDTWRNEDQQEWHQRILPFQHGMRMLPNDSSTWESWFSYSFNVEELIRNGSHILKYIDKHNVGSCKRAFTKNLFGYRAICLNATGNSAIFDSVFNPAEHDIMVLFSHTGAAWKVSLYTTKEKGIDCSAIAQTMGGGGHLCAAGFTTSDIGMLLFNNEGTADSSLPWLLK